MFFPGLNPVSGTYPVPQVSPQKIEAVLGTILKLGIYSYTR
jgi:hypothetical protein